MNVFTPRTIEEYADVLRTTTRTHPRLRIAGAGTAAGWGCPDGEADAVLNTTGLTGVQAYNPADMTVSVAAGTPLAELQSMLAEHRQRIAVDPARAARRATVGGLLATADAGPLRSAYGTLRDLVIGSTAVLADGTVTHAGGHVIKNVAGYDLSKLFHGSMGTLGLVAGVVLRVHPMPRASATVAIAVTVDDAFAAAGRIAAQGLEAAALEWRDGGSSRPAELLVRIEGTPAGVEKCVGRLRSSGAPVSWLLSDQEAAQAWSTVAQVADVGDGGRDTTVVRVGTLPSAGPALIDDLAARADELGVELAVTSSLLSGIHTVRLEPAAVGAHRTLVTWLAHRPRTELVVVHGAGLGVDAAADPATSAAAWSVPPASAELMRRVKRRFDPTNRFGTGRLGPWLAPEELR